MKRFIVPVVLVLGYIIGFIIYNFPEGENPIFSSGRINIGEAVKRLVSQERSNMTYRYYIIFEGQPEFRMEKSTWGGFTGDEKFGYIPKGYSKWEYLSWPGGVTPGKERKHHEEIAPTTSIFTPVISKELSGEIEPPSDKWKSWDRMWGPKKSQ